VYQIEPDQAKFKLALMGPGPALSLDPLKLPDLRRHQKDIRSGRAGLPPLCLSTFQTLLSALQVWKAALAPLCRSTPSKCPISADIKKISGREGRFTVAVQPFK
ncbi:MAG: hypothetical protein ACREAC_18900, partial [Blastocatellia bacterium]